MAGKHGSSGERQVTPQQKGGLGESLLTSHLGEFRRIFEPFVRRDLFSHERERTESFLREIQEDSGAEDLGDVYVDVKIRRRRAERYHLYNDGEHFGWIPDCEFGIEIIPDIRAYTTKMLEFQYPIEVKSGNSSTLSENQRRAMELLEAEDDTTVPVRARVSVDSLPETYEVTFSRIHGRYENIDRRTPDRPDRG